MGQPPQMENHIWGGEAEAEAGQGNALPLRGGGGMDHKMGIVDRPPPGDKSPGYGARRMNPAGRFRGLRRLGPTRPYGPASSDEKHIWGGEGEAEAGQYNALPLRGGGGRRALPGPTGQPPQMENHIWGGEAEAEAGQGNALPLRGGEAGHKPCAPTRQEARRVARS
jgi:hypothetical protein